MIISTNNSGKTADEYADIDSRIIIIHKPNGGLSNEKNTGIDIITGEYIVFVDSDHLIEVYMYTVLCLFKHIMKYLKN